MRKFVFTLVLFLFILFTFLVVTLMEKTAADAEKIAPSVICSGGVAETKAIVDYATPLELRTGDFHCFCSNKYDS